jgi:hypothetical protein
MTNHMIIKNPDSSQYQLVPGVVTNSDSPDRTTKPQRFLKIDELKITV